MDSKREQAFVGLFVIIAAVVLIAAVFGITGAFQGSVKTFHAEFPNAAGLEPGATVRYAGGPKVGRVEKLQIDPRNVSLIDITFSVASNVPVKTDSKATILSISPLGDNHLEVLAGTAGAPLASTGALLQARPYLGLNDLTEEINKLSPQAQQLLANLNERVTQLKITLDRVNDVLNDQNRANISGSLSDLHGMLRENRPQIRSTVQNVNAASEKIQPLLEQLHKTMDQANETLKHVDSLIGENREDIRASVIKLRQSLENVSILTQRLDLLLDVNAINIDEILDNLRQVSENLRQFTETIKTQPSTLIRSQSPRPHVPGGKP
jgi:phospholipid/cholesterol/gamma-HCH transport system substrate-binding protein